MAERWQTFEYVMRLARQELRTYGDTDRYRKLISLANTLPLKGTA